MLHTISWQCMISQTTPHKTLEITQHSPLEIMNTICSLTNGAALRRCATKSFDGEHRKQQYPVNYKAYWVNIMKSGTDMLCAAHGCFYFRL